MGISYGGIEFCGSQKNCVCVVCLFVFDMTMSKVHSTGFTCVP